MMKQKIAALLIMTALGSGNVSGFATLNNTSDLYKNGNTSSKLSVADGENNLYGEVFNVGNSSLGAMIPIAGTPVPDISKYKGGKVSVGALYNFGPNSSNEQEFYSVNLYGADKQLIGNFAIPASALSNLTSYNASQNANEVLGLFKANQLNQIQPCAQSYKEKRQSPEQERKYRERLNQRAKENRARLLPEERFTPGVSNTPFSEYDYSGDAPFAGGNAGATAGGTGLILTREDDPHASNITEGCLFLAGVDKESEMAGEMSYTKEDYKRCANNIHKKVLSGLSPLSENNRAEFFGRIFKLPNQEQELIASLYTLKGEMERGNMADGVMILKVLNNRRDNANKVQDAIKQCNEQHGEGTSPEKSTCIGEANNESVFNLLDVAVHRVNISKTPGKFTPSPYGQFSMFNKAGNPGQGNWNKVLDSTNDNLLDEQLDVLMAYSESKIEVSGGVDPGIIYHYVNPDVSPNPGWINYIDTNIRRPKRQVKVTLPDGSVVTTNKHDIYENVDATGVGNQTGDGFRVPVQHEFRTF